tara:strand:- start:56 stop:715 length:660 start_codon:yes stop_codon:yes gene_type:complete
MSFDQNQIAVIQEKRSDLRFLPTNTDVFVMEFLRIYDIYSEPTDVGTWNGWDTVSALDAVLNISRGGSSVASSIFYSGRSMQVSQSSKQKAEDWTTWKRWALDHKEFEKFKTSRIKEIENYNTSILEKINSPELEVELKKIVAIWTATKKWKSFYWKFKFLLYGAALYIMIVGLYRIYENIWPQEFAGFWLVFSPCLIEIIIPSLASASRLAYINIKTS